MRSICGIPQIAPVWTKITGVEDDEGDKFSQKLGDEKRKTCVYLTTQPTFDRRKFQVNDEVNKDLSVYVCPSLLIIIGISTAAFQMSKFVL